MNISPLYTEIVKIRQEKAGSFAAILEKAKPLYHTLVQVMESALVSPKPEKSAAIKEKLQDEQFVFVVHNNGNICG